MDKPCTLIDSPWPRRRRRPLRGPPSSSAAVVAAAALSCAQAASEGSRPSPRRWRSRASSARCSFGGIERGEAGVSDEQKWVNYLFLFLFHAGGGRRDRTIGTTHGQAHSTCAIVAQCDNMIVWMCMRLLLLVCVMAQGQWLGGGCANDARRYKGGVQTPTSLIDIWLMQTPRARSNTTPWGMEAVPKTNEHTCAQVDSSKRTIIRIAQVASRHCSFQSNGVSTHSQSFPKLGCPTENHHKPPRPTPPPRTHLHPSGDRSGLHYDE